MGRPTGRHVAAIPAWCTTARGDGPLLPYVRSPHAGSRLTAAKGPIWTSLPRSPQPVGIASTRQACVTVRPRHGGEGTPPAQEGRHRPPKRAFARSAAGHPPSTLCGQQQE